jgi:hypothetical protein
MPCIQILPGRFRQVFFFAFPVIIIMGREEYTVTCTCGITQYSISLEVDPGDEAAPRRLVVRCSRCGRMSYMMEEHEGDLWQVYERMPFP